jgi:hypothetical protein
MDRIVLLQRGRLLGKRDGSLRLTEPSGRDAQEGQSGELPPIDAEITERSHGLFQRPHGRVVVAEI